MKFVGKDAYLIGSVLRALDILNYLADRGGAGRVSDIAKTVRCSKNTAFRLLKTLQERDFVRQGADSTYALTFKLLDLGSCVLQHSELHTVAHPHLEELVHEFGETASLAVIDGHEIVYVDRVLGSQPYHTSYSIGSRVYAHSTALGKAILAHSRDDVISRVLSAGLKRATEWTITDAQTLLADLRATLTRGYSFDNQENVFGIRCVGAPIFDRNGDVVAAISVAALAARLTDDHAKAVAARVLSQAEAISMKLGYSGKGQFPPGSISDRSSLIGAVGLVTAT